jgi:hypothetical protein
VEFKQPNRYADVRPRINIPQRGNPKPITPPVSKPSTNDITKVTSPVHDQYKILNKKTIVLSSVVILALISFLIVGSIIHQQNSAKNADNASDSGLVVENLEYQTIVPDGKSISELGGWKRVSPAGSDPVFAYTDTIGAVSISVSQQPLPKSFVGDTDNQVAELAKKFSATNKIQSADTTIYVGSSSKGPQSAIFTKNGLLILIKSQEKIEDAAWAKYAKSLN